MPFGQHDFKKPEFRKVSDVVWEIPKTFKAGMNVPARIFASKGILDAMDLQVYDQITNVATLPGILKFAFCMPDGHSGYGFPIGGVAAFDADNGVISPGGIGFDINCGMRLVLTNLTVDDIRPKLKELVDKLYQKVPAGVGSTGFVKLSREEFKKVVMEGSEWCVRNGYGWKEDLEKTELYGIAKDADVSKVSDKAISRGYNQIGTLGSGNHYLEIQVVKEENIHDKKLAKKWGLFPNQIVIMFHCLPGNAKVLTEHGYTIEIQKLKESWGKTNVKCLDVKSHEIGDTSIVNFFEINKDEKILRIVTKSGKELIATEDHPVLTPSGLKLMTELKIGDRVAVLPFEGVEYEEPSDYIIVSEQDIRKIENNDEIVENLKKRGLLPLRMNSDKLPTLAKLLGFLTGDGWLGKAGKRWSLKFIGKPPDLEDVRKDIEKLGYKATKPYSQECTSNIKFTDGEARTISGRTNTIVVGSLGLPILLYAMGAPSGSKSKKEFEVPRWIFKAPLWIKRLYLAGYLGAEMTKPSVRKKEGYRFGRPMLSINKYESLKKNGNKFLLQVRELLGEFGVEATNVTEHVGVETKEGKRTVKLRLNISSEEANLIRLWSKIGFEYCKEREILSAYATQYLHLKNRILEKESRMTGKSTSKLAVTSFKFRSIKYPTFSEFREEFKLNPPTPVIWDAIEKIEEVKDSKGKVYDIRVSHADHNFIANSFVTGNCGSRGFGHQVASDYLELFLSKMEREWNIKIVDRELASAPFKSKDAQDYFKAMHCAVNISFANRQVILHRIREVFSEVFRQDAEKLGLHQLFDIAHNRASLEKHKVDGQTKEIIVHRKGATGSYPPGREEIPKFFKADGSPVIIGGSMETGSYLLVGAEGANETWCSTTHGSGRTMSRTKAKHTWRGETLQREMQARGIYVKSVSWAGLAEEAGGAYKDIDEVIDATHRAKLSLKIAKLIPIGNVKG